MNSELKKKVDEFINDFLEIKEVKQYLLLKKEILESNEIKELEKSLKKAQKEMALSLGTPSYNENKKIYLELKERYDRHPLVVNFNVMQEEVGYLLNELKNRLEIK